MSLNLGELATEGRLPESIHIDRCSTAEMLQIINAQDRLVAAAVDREIPRIARAVDLIADRLRCDGRLVYVGAGTSGRLAVLDASEMPPTYGVPPEMVQAVIAGGLEAVFSTREGAEDDPEAARTDIAALVRPGDAVVGIAASGRTPYTVAALEAARALGCATVAVTNNARTPLGKAADVAIAPVVGPEVIMGSTRMKAGTAQKLVLNMLSTGVMIKLGKVYTNLMVDMQCSNEKLYHRAVRMIMLATGAGEAEASVALDRSGRHAKTALVGLLAGLEPEEARRVLVETGGFVRQAVGLAEGRVE